MADQRVVRYIAIAYPILRLRALRGPGGATLPELRLHQRFGRIARRMDAEEGDEKSTAARYVTRPCAAEVFRDTSNVGSGVGFFNGFSSD